jgi:transglutaminase-like putative cysteine protease
MRRTIGGILSVSAALLAFPAAGQPSGADQQPVQGPAPAWAKPSEPLPIPQDTTGLAFIRAQDVVVHLDRAGQSTYFGDRIVILQPQALQLGNVGLSWNPASGAPMVHAVKIHRGSETIDVLRSSKFEILRREDQLEAAMLTGTLTAVLKVPDLRVGDELELAYTLPSSDPTLKDQNAGILAINGSNLPGRYRLGLSWETGEEPHVRATDDLGGKIQRSPSGLDIRLDNPPILTPPKDAPFRYSWQRLVEFSDFATWPDLSRRFSGLFEQAARLRADSPLKQEAARIAADHPDALGRAQAALKLVQQQVRYVYIGLDGGNFRPAAADDTWQRRYGDCKAKTALLLALLGELGIRGEPVLARNQGSDDGFDMRLPSPSLFDHVLVRATIAGKAYWLDGTLPAVATPSLTPDFPYHWVLPMTASGHELESLPWTPESKPDTLELYEIDARAGVDKPARIVTTSISRGPKALVEYAQLSALSADQLLQGLRSNMTGDSSWNSIDSVRYRYDEAERASVLEIAGTGPLNWDRDSDQTSRSMALPGGGFSPPGRRQRAADQDQKAPFYDEPNFSCHVTTVRLPADTKEQNWSFNSTFDSKIYGQLYYRAFDRRDGSVRMIRGSRTEQPEIDAAAAQRDNARLNRFDNSMAWLSYTPGKPFTVPAGTAPVPATYEGDWLHSSDACLPKDLRPATSIAANAN